MYRTITIALATLHVRNQWQLASGNEVCILTYCSIVIIFLSHRPTAQKKRGTGLIFTQNVTTGDGGVHHPQVIDSSTPEQIAGLPKHSMCYIQFPHTHAIRRMHMRDKSMQLANIGNSAKSIL